MEDKKDLYAEEAKKLGIEDLDSVSGGGGDYISKRLPKEVAKEYLRTRSKHVQVTEDYINKKISKEEYDAACREFREYKKNLKKSMACKDDAPVSIMMADTLMYTPGESEWCIG